MYLSAIEDLFNGEVLAWKIGEHCNTQLVIETVEMLKQNVGNLEGCILHSDAGSTYTAYAYRELLLSFVIENICIYKKRCPNLKCNGCQKYTPRRPLSLNILINQNDEYDVVDKKANIEDIVIRKEQINEALKKLQKVDAVLARIAKMAMASDTCEFIEIKTGIPKSTVNDMLEKAEKILSNNT